MKKSQKNESIFESLSLLKKGLLSIKQKENCEDIEKSISVIDEIIVVFKGYRSLILILIVALIVSISVAVLSNNYNTKVEDFNREIKDYRNDSIVRKILDIEELDAGDSVTTRYNYVTRGKEIVTYNQFNLENDSLEKVIESLKLKMLNNERKIAELDYQVALAKDKLDLAYKYYGIKFIKQDEYIIIEGTKIDSALVLLEVFRKKLQYDEKTKSWTINK
jgi:hypothetical protein